jgi:nucleotide-binding universal stress UspA family protein
VTDTEVAPPLRGDTFTGLVVPLGRSASSELALAPAAELAQRLGAGLHLLSVGIEEDEAEEMARRLAVLAPAFGATAETRVDYDVAATVLQVARERDPALVCMASHGRGRLSEAVLGSYTTAVLAAATTPVLLAGPRLDPTRRMADGPVLACVDGSDASEAGVAVATAWARMLRVPLDILTVAPAGSERVGSPAGPGADLPEQLGNYLGSLVQRWQRPGLQVRGRTVHDDSPARAIVGLVEDAPAGLLVVTTHARTGLPRMAFGSVTTAVVRSSPLPVLVVPPPVDRPVS